MTYEYLCSSGRAIDLDESPIVINLLQFVSTFSECHLERCLAGAASSPELLTQITLFLREMAALSVASTDPAVSYSFHVLILYSMLFLLIFLCCGEYLFAVVSTF